MKKYCMKCMRIISNGDVCGSCGNVVPQELLPHRLAPGTILRGRYLVGNSLGQGGFGITYIGCDLLLNFRVAIKEYYPSGYANRNVNSSTEVSVSEAKYSEIIANGKEKFLNEARVLAEFYDTPGIVDVRDFFEENNTAYIVMEYLDGVTLQECIKNNSIAPEVVVKLFMPIMDSLQKIHEKKTIHRDISPDNIMLLTNGSLKLMDFGAARQVDYSDPKSMSVVLKNGFAPVEQYRSKGELGPWTDVYALVASMYVCLTGVVPDVSLERAFEDTVKWPREMGIPISQTLEAVIKKGMAVKSEDRYQTVAELAQDLQKALLVPTMKDEKTVGHEYTITADSSSRELSDLVAKIMQDNLAKEAEQPVKEKVITFGKHSYAQTIATITDENKLYNETIYNKNVTLNNEQIEALSEKAEAANQSLYETKVNSKSLEASKNGGTISSKSAKVEKLEETQNDGETKMPFYFSRWFILVLTIVLPWITCGLSLVGAVVLVIVRKKKYSRLDKENNRLLAVVVGIALLMVCLLAYNTISTRDSLEPHPDVNVIMKDTGVIFASDGKNAVVESVEIVSQNPNLVNYGEYKQAYEVEFLAKLTNDDSSHLCDFVYVLDGDEWKLYRANKK